MGLRTFDGNVKGKSNELEFPNQRRDVWEQQTCDKNPTLTFQFCETSHLRAWTGCEGEKERIGWI